MKTAIAAVLFLAVLSLTPVRLGAQTSSNPTEKDFVSGGRVAITLESGAYEVRASADNRIHVRWNEASGARVKLTQTANLLTCAWRTRRTIIFTPPSKCRRLLTCVCGLPQETCECPESKATKILRPMLGT
jgi:hypothetical protein